MKNSKPSPSLLGDVALISIHPPYVKKIMSGEKKLEFRRVWPTRPVEALVVYSTHPEQRLMGVVEIVGVLRASKTALWRAASEEGGGITRRALFDYMDGKQEGVALRLGAATSLGSGVSPSTVFGPSFRAPQSFRYLTAVEKVNVRKLMEGTRK